MGVHRFVIVDVFTDTPLAGNQLAVFTDGRSISEDMMPRLAREIGFSETVFVRPPSQGGHAAVRIFTPERELAFAGHPVLGTAFVLGAPLQLTIVKLETTAGVVPVVLQREGAKIIFGTMVQPMPTWAPFDRADELLSVLGIEHSELPIEIYDNGSQHVYVACESAEQVASLQPDGARLRTVVGVAGVNCFFAEDARVKTRMFMPEAGVLEDAATGSAAGPLAIHLARHGRIEWGTEVEVSQGTEIGRPSRLYARPHAENGELSAIEVGGSAVIVARGEFSL